MPYVKVCLWTVELSRAIMAATGTAAAGPEIQGRNAHNGQQRSGTYGHFNKAIRQAFVTACRRSPRRLRGPLDTEGLSAFGEMLVPRSIWEAMRTHACWIEPALVTEWARKMATYRDARSAGLSWALHVVAAVL